MRLETSRRDGPMTSRTLRRVAVAALAALGQRGKKAPPAAIVLLSDGASQSGKDPNTVAQQAKAAGVPIYTVALGTPDGVVQTPDGQMLQVPPDPEALQQIASASGGRAFTAKEAYFVADARNHPALAAPLVEATSARSAGSSSRNASVLEAKPSRSAIRRTAADFCPQPICGSRK